MTKQARLARSTDKSLRLLYAVAGLLVLLILLSARHADGAERSTGTSPSLAAATATLTATLTVQRAPVILFTTPPPVRTEEPLTGANRNFPSGFAGVDTYERVPATLSVTDPPPLPATSIAEAALAVVQIHVCEDAGCEPAGSGVILHPSGLILTAYHVLQTDPDDPTSARYPDFAIAITTATRNEPELRYRARMVAQKDEQDLALLLIDRDLAGTPLAPDQIELPTLPLADIANLFGGELTILGYPVSGGEAISQDPANFRSFDDGGRLIVVDRALDSGNSGGPALVEQTERYEIAGIVIRRRSTQGQLSQTGLLRAIDQLDTLTWTPKMTRAWGEAVQADVQASAEGDLLRLTLTLNTLDLRARSLRLLFYATDVASGQPWQPDGARAPLLVWANVAPQQVIEQRTLTLSVPVARLGTTPDRLRFYTLLWDTEEGGSLWADAEGVQAAPGAVALASTAIPTIAPTPTSTATPNPTATQVPTATSTNLPTNTPTATPTATPSPTPMPTFTPTYTPTPGGLITYFTQNGDKKSLYVLNSDGTSTALVEGVADVIILDVSPDRRYLALAISDEGEIVQDPIHLRFLKSPKIHLIVVSTDGHELNVIRSQGYAFDAAYNANGELFLAILDSGTGPYRTVNYAVAKTDGSELREFYSSQNYFPSTPTPISSPTVER